MTQTAFNIAANAIRTEMPEINVTVSNVPQAASTVNVFDAPRIVIGQALNGDVFIQIHVDEADDLDGITANVHRLLSRVHRVGDLAASFTFSKSLGLIDDADFLVGNDLRYKAHIQSELAAAA